jgi:hypothetical protein
MAAPQQNLYNQTFTTNQVGEILLTGILNVADFQQVNIMIISNFVPPAPPLNMTVECYMGQLSRQTVGQMVGQFALVPGGALAKIYTFDVVGPEFSVVLKGAPNTDVPIQAWVFLH